MLPLGGIATAPPPNDANLNSILFKKGNNNVDVTKVSQSKPYIVDEEDEDTLASPTIKQNSVPYVDPAIVSVIIKHKSLFK